MMEDRTRSSRRRAEDPPPPRSAAPAGSDEPTRRMASPHTPPPTPEPERESAAGSRPEAGVSAEPAAPEPEPTTGWLVVVSGPGEGSALTLGYGSHSLGRDESQRLRFDFGDPDIAGRSHAVVTYDDSGRRFYVSHGGGSAVARLNGQPVLQPQVLAAEDRLRIGRTEMMFVPFCGVDFDWRDP